MVNVTRVLASGKAVGSGADVGLGSTGDPGVGADIDVAVGAG
jgi:hypothetical protein